MDRFMKTRAILIGLMALATPILVQSQHDDNTVAKIIDEGKNRNQVMDHLRHLTKNIGPRLTGSPQLQKACDYTMAKFKEYGLTNVHLEQWGEVPVGFERGKSSSGKMVSPEVRNFEFTSPAWTPGTNGPLRGKAVKAPTTMEEFEKVKESLKGAWVLMPPAAPRGGGGRGGRGGGGGAAAAGNQTPDPQVQLREAIDGAGIAGRVQPSRNELVITSGRYTGLTWETLPKTRTAIIRKSDMDAVTALLDAGKEVELEFNLDQKFLPGPVPVYNVIADIKGTEKPDEMVIVSGHLDSWDGPGAEGACDNGTGTMVAVETARILMKAGAKPKRTIRFIMWTGEEQGLHGSRRYVEMHKDELEKITCVFVDDGGTNYQGGVTCTKEMEPMLRAALEPAMKAFPDLPMEIRVADRIPAGGGSDHAPFNAAGVPGFFWRETGRSDYNYVHHTQHDKFEMAIPEYLVQSSTNSAAASYIVACAPTLLPRQAAAAAATARPNGAGGPPPKR